MIQRVKRKGDHSLCFITEICPCTCLASSHLPKSLGNLCCSAQCPRISWEMTTNCGRWLHSAKCRVDFTSADFCCEDCCSPVFSSSVEFMHPLLPYSSFFLPLVWCEKVSARKRKHPKTKIHDQSSCVRQLQFCIVPHHWFPGVIPWAHWALQWLLIYQMIITPTIDAD